jgi:dipeptidyl aminopeptidase/acylaminoacyl peptidase
MGLDLNRLLEIRLFQAFDVDESGRVLAGSDESGSTQLIEIVGDGTMTQLTALPGACTGRYVPGQRAVIVSHDVGGNERYQLSLLSLPRENAAAEADLEPLVRDPRYIHTLADVAPGRICYLTNRRNGVAFDPVIRDLANGTERTINLGDHRFEEAVISPDGRWLALTVASPVTAAADHVALVDLTIPQGGEQQLMLVSPPDAPAINRALAWTPDSDALIFSSSNDREFIAVARHDLATKELTWLVADGTTDLTGWLSPDGAVLLVERNGDGASELALYEAAAGGRKVRDLLLPAVGAVSGPRLADPKWAPDSRTIALSISSPELPGDVLLLDAGFLDAGTGGNQVRRLTHSACAFGADAPVLPEQHRVPAPDGEMVPCRVYRRPDQGKPDHADLAGSAVLVVHGGPELQARQNFDVVVQALAAAGHTVLVPNVRGSTGYGKRWYTADDKHRRLDSVADLAALHAYLPKLGVDQRRAALWGGS